MRGIDPMTQRDRQDEAIGVLKRLFAYDKKKPFRKITLENGRYFHAPSGTVRLEELLVYDDVESSPTPMNRIRAAFFPDNPNGQHIRSRAGAGRS